jgi:hypothetical protein
LGKRRHWPRVVVLHRRARDFLDAPDARAQRRFQLLVELRRVAIRRQEEISIDALEIAFDRFAPHDPLDGIDRRGVAVGGELRAFLAVQPFDLVPPVIHRGDQVRGRARGHAATDRPVVDDDDGASLLRKQISGRDARDAGATTHTSARALPANGSRTGTGKAIQGERIGGLSFMEYLARSRKTSHEPAAFGNNADTGGQTFEAPLPRR